MSTRTTDSTRYDRFEASGTDLDEACARYSEVFSGARLRAESGSDQVSFRYASAGDERLTLRTSTFSGRLHGDVPFLTDYVVAWFRSGTGVLNHRRGRRETVESAPYLLPSEQAFDLDFTPHRQNLVHLSADFVEDTASELHGGPAQVVAFDHAADPRPEALVRWREAVASATPAIVGQGSSPLARLEAQLAIARALLHLFPWSAVDIPATVRTPRTARLREAVEFVHEHAHEPITPSDIARAAHLHTRTLQQAMNQHMGTTPSGYLRQVRLDRVRRELVAAAPGDARVAEVAVRWGFGNLGRFSAAYTARFGEYPSDTLARWRSGDTVAEKRVVADRSLGAS